MLHVGRYRKEEQLVSTRLDPLRDALQWLRGLRSERFTEDLLTDVHGMGALQAHESANAVAAHARMALDLLEQGLGGPQEASFLPLYYGFLDLAKIVVIASGRLSSLHAQRHHGVEWTGIRTRSADLLTDHITLHGKGALPLFYQALTGSMWPKTARKKKDGTWTSTHSRQIQLRQIYPLIPSVSYEYGTAYDLPEMLASLSVGRGQTVGKSKRFQIWFDTDQSPTTHSKRHFGILAGWIQSGDAWVTPAFRATSWENALKKADSWGMRRFLLYERAAKLDVGGAELFTSTPISNSNLLLPEEFPLLLVMFHLGSVVRYDPQRMQRLIDSKAAILISILPAQCTLRFIELCWSYLQKRTVQITAP